MTSFLNTSRLEVKVFLVSKPIIGTYWVQNHQDKNKNICSKIKNKNNSSKFQTFPQAHTAR